jgi:4-deoxy-L-threo-5-hexosulose-uronate ketol-isomerase
MEIRNAVHPDQAVLLDTAELREHFLVQNLFVPGALKLVYTHYDRLIVGGACPVDALALEADPAVIGAAFLLERREMGVINIGAPGTVTVDGTRYPLGPKDGLYIGRGSRTVGFESADPRQPARFYLNSAPAHASHPTQAITPAAAAAVQLGSMEKSNRRTIRKYIHPDGVRSCQLVMGMTTLEAGSVWNTMPTHTHPRRIEAYLYFDLPEDEVVMHVMGEPRETRHLVVRDGEAVLSPSWSIHSGVGTCAYTFIWGMAGENQTFTDMDAVPMAALK